MDAYATDEDVSAAVSGSQRHGSRRQFIHKAGIVPVILYMALSMEIDITAPAEISAIYAKIFAHKELLRAYDFCAIRCRRRNHFGLLFQIIRRILRRRKLCQRDFHKLK